MSSSSKLLSLLVLVFICSAETKETSKNLPENPQNLVIVEIISLAGENIKTADWSLGANEENYLDTGIVFYENQDLQSADTQNVTNSNQESQKNETTTNQESQQNETSTDSKSQQNGTSTNTTSQQNETSTNSTSQNNATSTNSTTDIKDSSDGFAVYYVIIVILVVAMSILATAYFVYRNKSTTNDSYVRV